MPTIYSPAPEVDEIARPIIREHHEHLNTHNVRMEFVFVTPTPKRHGKYVYGSARKITSLAAFFAQVDDPLVTGDKEEWTPPAETSGDSTNDDSETVEEAGAKPFFVIAISSAQWVFLDPKQKVALVDHELMHCDSYIDDKGNVALKMRGHDLEEFRDIVQRHGYWMDGIDKFVAALDGHNPQLRLADLDKEPEPETMITVTTKSGSVSMPVSSLEKMAAGAAQ